jgi:uncharacterized protein (UPF0332 family)
MVETEVQSRIALARLMVAEELLENLPGELGMRTALSRAYYGLFHSAYAVLLSVNDVTAGVRLKHRAVSKLVRRRLGSAVGQVYEDALSARREADYESTARFSPILVSRQLKVIRTHVHWFCMEASKVLK